MRRLLEEPGSDLDRVLLEAGLDEAPPPRAAERTLAALGLGSAAVVGVAALSAGATSVAAGGAASAATGTAAGAKATLLGVGLTKLFGAVVLVSAAGAGAYVWSQRDAAPAAPAAAVVPVDAAASSAPAFTPAVAEPEAPRALATGVDETSPAPRDTAAPRTKVRSTPPRVTETGSAAGSLGAESSLLDQARRAELAGDVEACRARIAAYRSRFPAGQLAKDASAIKCKAPK
ncbi:MAG: hypothetical protein IPG04_19140 [Polyangiaceae bacterium]|nr:hypothetical protein [Polyangiaceae bacterium]